MDQIIKTLYSVNDDFFHMIKLNQHFFDNNFTISNNVKLPIKGKIIQLYIISSYNFIVEEKPEVKINKPEPLKPKIVTENKPVKPVQVKVNKPVTPKVTPPSPVKVNKPIKPVIPIVMPVEKRKFNQLKFNH